MAFSPDGTSSQPAGSGWRVRSGCRTCHRQTIQTLTGHTAYVYKVAFSPDGALLATASGDGTARLWDIATGRAIRTLACHADGVYKVAFSPDGTLLATLSYDKTARLWG